MRQLPDQWAGPERLNWVCVALEMLSENSLAPAASLLSGLQSIEQATGCALVIQNLRRLAPGLVTLGAIRHATERYVEHHEQQGTEPLFVIDPDTLVFARRPGLLLAPELEAAEGVLRSELPLAASVRRFADPAREMSVRFGSDGIPVPVQPLGFVPAPPPLHALCREREPGVSIAWADLIEEARSMDAEDLRRPDLRPGSWEDILRAAQLVYPDPTGQLDVAEYLNLEGVQHLIGLPGSGKTTLLTVLCRLLAKRGKRVALLLPSIEVSRQYLAKLERYGVPAGLLVGQSDLTRRSHMSRLAETIAAGADGGFGVTLPGADRFGANCVLAAFARDGVASWPYAAAPCDQVLQAPEGRSRPGKRMCPLWGSCGRNLAPRELPEAQVWLGHVRSMDTWVPKAFSERRLTYYELLARTFDLVIFDEADGVQKNLDAYGANQLSLSGSSDSMHRVVQEQIQTRFARGENHHLSEAEVSVYTRELAEFGNQTNALIHCVANLGRGLSKRHEGELLTPARILSELVWRGAGELSRPEREAQSAFLRKVLSSWDRASLTAVRDRTGLADDQPDEPADARSHLADFEDRLVTLFRSHLAAVYTRHKVAIQADITDLVAEVVLGKPATSTEREAIGLLLHVTFVIRSYQRVVPGTRTMVSEGLLAEHAVSTALSRELRQFCPESLLGRLSGVRYEVNRRDEKNNIRLSYVSFVAAPRALMTRLPELLAEETGSPGPAVLLTSATSYLEDSPAYHVDAGVPLVLRKSGQGLGHEGSRFAFRPVADHASGGQPLRYSGAGARRERNLLAIVDHLVGRGIRRAEVLKVSRRFDVVANQPRKAALVVNSYAQAERIKEHIDRAHPAVGARTIAVVRPRPDQGRRRGFVTPAQVPELGDDPGWDILVFPMGALGRGTNVVYSTGPRARHAAIGSIWFLTRPHPPVGDLGLLEALAGRAAQEFDQRDFAGLALAQVTEAHAQARNELYATSQRLMREPLMASRLGRLFRPFTANLMVEVLQTIGRGMRGHRPVQAFFVDAAWAPNSAAATDEADDAQTSMLVQMLEILADLVDHDDPRRRAIYRELYLPFALPFAAMDGLVLPEILKARLAALEL